MTVTTGDIAAPHRPDTIALEPTLAIPTAAVVAHATFAGAIEGDAPSVRLGYNGDDASADVYAEGEEIAETTNTLPDLVVKTRKVATIIKYSNETGRANGGRAGSDLAASLQRAVVRKADELLFNSPLPVDPEDHSGGLLLLPGMQVAEVEDDLAPLIWAKALAAEQGGLLPTDESVAQPSTSPVWVMSATAYAALSMLRIDTGAGAESKGAFVLGAGVNAGAETLLGCPVIINRAIPALSGILLSPSDIYAATGPVFVATSTDAAFTADSEVARVTFRSGWGVIRPERMVRFTIEAPAGYELPGDDTPEDPDPEDPEAT